MNRSPAEMLNGILEKYQMPASTLCKQIGVSHNLISRIRKGGLISAKVAVLLDDHGYPGSEMFHEQARWRLDQIPQHVRDDILKNVDPLN